MPPSEPWERSWNRVKRSLNLLKYVGNLKQKKKKCYLLIHQYWLLWNRRELRSRTKKSWLRSCGGEGRLLRGGEFWKRYSKVKLEKLSLQHRWAWLLEISGKLWEMIKHYWMASQWVMKCWASSTHSSLSIIKATSPSPMTENLQPLTTSLKQSMCYPTPCDPRRKSLSTPRVLGVCMHVWVLSGIWGLCYYNDWVVLAFWLWPVPAASCCGHYGSEPAGERSLSLFAFQINKILLEKKWLRLIQCFTRMWE